MQPDNRTCKGLLMCYAANNNACECIDINECLSDNGGCEQICSNIVGSHQCSCRHGYQLAGDNRTCIGMWIPYMCFSDNYIQFILIFV